MHCPPPPPTNGETKLTLSNVITSEHAPSPVDLALPDFYPFPQLKMTLKRHRVADSLGVMEHLMKRLIEISQYFFQECFQQLCDQWEVYGSRRVFRSDICNIVIHTFNIAIEEALQMTLEMELGVSK